MFGRNIMGETEWSCEETTKELHVALCCEETRCNKGQREQRAIEGKGEQEGGGERAGEQDDLRERERAVARGQREGARGGVRARARASSVGWRHAGNK